MGTASANQHHAVLLDIVTLAGNVGGDLLARRQTHTRRLSLARVGLLRPHDTDLEADALHRRGAFLGERRGDSVPRTLGFSAASEHLIEGSILDGCGGKGARGR